MSVVETAQSFDSWPAERLETEITLLAAHLAAAECRWLQMVAAFDRREAWGTWGCASAAHWLNWRCALAPGAARERVRVARRLAELPLVTSAFAVGELSYSKVRALTRVATPVNEEALVDLARSMTASHLERTVRCYKLAGDAAGRDQDSTSDPAEQYAERYLKTWWNDDGTLSINAKLPPAEGRLVMAAIERAMDAAFRAEHCTRGATGKCVDGDSDLEDVPAESPANDSGGRSDITESHDDVPTGTPAHARDPEPAALPDGVPAGTPDADIAAESPPPRQGWAARQADALVAIAETIVASGLRPGSGPNRHTVVIHTTASALAGGANDDGGSYIENGPRLPRDTVRRLMCDASLMFALDGPDGTVVNVSPRAPSVPTALARAVKLRDGCCVFPGCTHHAFVDIHHIKHRADDGVNSLTNVACLCKMHHRMVHEGGFSMKSSVPGHFEFSRPDGTPLSNCPVNVPAGDAALRLFNAANGVDPAGETTVPDWDGRHPNYAMIIDLLLSIEQTPRVPPESSE